MFWGWSDFKFSWTLICCHLVLKKVWFFELKFSQNLLYRNKTSSVGTLFFVLFVQIFQFKVFSFKELLQNVYKTLLYFLKGFRNDRLPKGYKSAFLSEQYWWLENNPSLDLQNQYVSNLFHCFAFPVNFSAKNRVPLLLLYLFKEGISPARPSCLSINILNKRNTGFVCTLNFPFNMYP